MTSQLTSQFNPLGIVSPPLLSGKPVLHKLATFCLDWNEKLLEAMEQMAYYFKYARELPCPSQLF